MHHELMAMVSKKFTGVLPSPIPYLSQIERMGIEREPVAAFSPESVASKSYQDLWGKIQETMLSHDKRERLESGRIAGKP